MDVGAALLALNINAGWLKIDSLGSETNGASVLTTLDDSETFAVEGLALVVLETLHAELASIIDTGYRGVALQREEHLILGIGTEVAVLIDHFDRHKRKAIDGRAIDCQTQMMGSTSRANGLRTHLCPTLAGYHLYLTGLVGDSPHHMIVVVALASDALTHAIHVELHLVGLVVVAP